ncbi:hypothetical protein FGIG_12340 [Fasciola gigantica]|uniref:Uncharacterized protein n=1 Tax=Fasciola gigantica TaxID=46835 RepID=A0A504YV18_FASGI|nr:hypothetical protein FGIG_12340 [Fasciola gigantica]
MMNWYDGNISDAIRLVREQSRTLLVFIRGTDEVSKVVDQLFDADVNAACENCVGTSSVVLSVFIRFRWSVCSLNWLSCICFVANSCNMTERGLWFSQLSSWIFPALHLKRSPHRFRAERVGNKPGSDLHQTHHWFHTSRVAKNRTQDLRSVQPLEERLKYAQQLLEAKRRLQTEEEKKKAIEAESGSSTSGQSYAKFQGDSHARMT